MKIHSPSHLTIRDVPRDLEALVARMRGTTADLLAHIGEFDARQLYLKAAHPSTHSYCVHELGMCEEAARERIEAARAARRFPAIFDAVADGRLHLEAVVMLAPYLTEETVGELLTAAAYKTENEIEQLLAQRFSRPDLPPSA